MTADILCRARCPACDRADFHIKPLDAFQTTRGRRERVWPGRVLTAMPLSLLERDE
jgi:hypothetical protein